MWGSKKKSIYLNVCRNQCHLWFSMSPEILECVPRGVKALWRAAQNEVSKAVPAAPSPQGSLAAQ